MRPKSALLSRQNQWGRSLVEVLGVLVVIGVLSLIGMWGIGYAMEKNRENETLNRFAKVVAGARTSRILQNLGDATIYDTQTGEDLAEFAPQVVDMHDVISNIGDDIIVENKEGQTNSYIFAPLEGPVKDGTEKPVEIYVYVETPEAFTVYADHLTKAACQKIVRANLGYSFAYEAAENTDKWRVPAVIQTSDGADLFCNQIATGQETALASYFNPFVRQAVAETTNKKGGTLVMWFGPFSCLGKDCAPPSCQGAECCCEVNGTKVQLKNPAPIGCAPAQGGSCESCAAPDSDGICRPKSGVDTCGETCEISLCPSKDKPYYCGEKLCCSSAEACGDGECKNMPITPKCTDASRPTVCGEYCCSTDEECVDGKCEPKGENACRSTEQSCYKENGVFSHCCSQNERCCGITCCGNNETCVNDRCEENIDCGTNEACGASGDRKCCQSDERCVENQCVKDECPSPSKYWCVEDKVCCSVTQGCDFDTEKCIANNCAKNEITCGDACCDKRTETCHPGYRQGVNGLVVPPFCQKMEQCLGVMCLDGCCGPGVIRCGTDGRCPWATGGGGDRCSEKCPPEIPAQCGDCTCCRKGEVCVD